MFKTGLISGAFFAALGIILGAFGAHALREVVPGEQLTIFETGVRYQMYHAFGLIAAGIVFRSFPFLQIKLASVFFIIGILLFSGSLYAMTFLKIQGQVGLGGLGMITPIGGLFFILGWILFIWSVLRKTGNKKKA